MGRCATGIVAALLAAFVFAGSAPARPAAPIVLRYIRLHGHATRHESTWPLDWRARAYRHLKGVEWHLAPVASRPAAPKAATAAPARAAQPDAAAQVALSSLDRAVLDRINGVRAQHGLRHLVVSAGLAAAAHQHSVEMVARGYFAHESADGSSFDRRIRRYYPRLRSAGENIAYGVPDLSASETMELWLNSPPHRRNLLDPNWREIGISVVHVESASGPDYQGDPTTVVTTDFGVRG